MPNLNNWLGVKQMGAMFSPENIINRDEVELIISRGDADLAAQCVRVVPISMGSQQGESAANNTPGQGGVVVIGNSDLDIKKNDFFVFRSTTYKIIFVNTAMPGQVQAMAEGMQ